MPRFVVNLTDKRTQKEFYVLWSTIVDGVTRVFNNSMDAHVYLKENLIPSEYEISVKALNTRKVSNPHYSIDDVIDSSGFETVEEIIDDL